MNAHGLLALAPQYTSTRELLAQAAHRRGMDVQVWSARDGLSVRGQTDVHYYGGPVFAAHLGKVLDAWDVALMEPSDGWLAALPPAHTGRRVTLTTLAEARRLTGPVFAKPPRDKSFPAAVHADGGSLPGERELLSDTPVLLSDVATWAAEFRLYVLEGAVLTGSQYATFGRLDVAPLGGHRQEGPVRRFAHDLLADCGDDLPSAVVVDVGMLSAPVHGSGDGEGWAVVEANMAWYSNCYAADPDRALEVVLRASGPRSRTSARDLPFCRARTEGP
ncbi:ATP-grasp domain-containing protein (plasmid) [Streptomyces sp. CA-294286]|uniref:ATP-grasp domain-containing protein n=1 Tax=Streptomyces sp. CA-294286 TaxID=3240070 RepID=UPI003D8F0EF1